MRLLNVCSGMYVLACVEWHDRTRPLRLHPRHYWSVSLVNQLAIPTTTSSKYGKIDASVHVYCTCYIWSRRKA
jgi:hypothetical protein